MSGTVLHVSGADTVPVSGSWVVLHGITATAGTALDSVRSDANGRFGLGSRAVDSLTSYLVSVAHQDVAYFSDPVVVQPGSVGTIPPLLVYDTSSTSPPIRLAERHVFLRRRERDGSRRVVELLVLANRGTETRIAPDWPRPVWTGQLPPEGRGYEVGLSDMSDEAIRFLGDTVAVAAPIPPGERELLVGYLLPADARELHLPIDQSVDKLAVLLEDSTISVAGAGLTFVGVGELEGGVIRRFEADSVEAGTPVTVRFTALPFQPSRLLWLLIPLAVGAFAFGLWRWMRLQRGAGADRGADRDGESPTALAAQIAALDAEFAGRETEDYRRQRATLKERLAQLLDRAG